MLKLLRQGGLVAALLVATAVFSRDASAQGVMPAPVVIVVDVQAALQKSSAAKSIRAERDRYAQAYQSEMDEQRKSLKDVENQLLKEKAALPSEEWQTKARAFERQVYDFNQRFQKSNQAIEKSFRTAMGELSQALAQVTEEVAGEMGANLVLHKMQVFLHDPRMEVTQIVIDRLNKRFPSIAFPAPVDEGQPASKPQARKK